LQLKVSFGIGALPLRVVYYLRKFCNFVSMREADMGQKLKIQHVKYTNSPNEISELDVNSMDSTDTANDCMPVDSVENLSILWKTYNSLPSCPQRDYVWDELFTTLSSMLKVVLKNTPDNEIIHSEEKFTIATH
jgi:hypothetical protein